MVNISPPIRMIPSSQGPNKEPELTIHPAFAQDCIRQWTAFLEE
jgi:hypothetical protein